MDDSLYRGWVPVPARANYFSETVTALFGGSVHDLQAWLMLHSPDSTGSGRSLAVIIAAGVILILILTMVVERQRPVRRVSRARHPDTIPTWGDLYLDSLAEAHRRPHRLPRGRIGAP